MDRIRMFDDQGRADHQDLKRLRQRGSALRLRLYSSSEIEGQVAQKQLRELCDEVRSWKPATKP